ncbi:hypothetical protein ODQ17_17165 [Acinetobacter sp. IRS14]|uniref:hypothetical protein n=1 Tax=Acinetobacter sp. IRS14 TaxID=2983398 RepID=UPI002AFEED1D|nr:hypothetical protein [Acinetobacter sp. IRS14]MEA1231107.1 hypothetical protein [Acinetobacter sp. IRS14]
MSNKVTTPYPLFSDIDGSPLNAGFLFLGVNGQDPEQNPINVYWNEEKTELATQPLRTRNGLIVRDDVPAKIFIEEVSCSISIKNCNQYPVQFVSSFDPPSSAKGVKAQIDAETIRATTAEAILSTQISGVNTTLSTSIANEVTRATSAELALQGQISSLGVGNRAYLTYAAMDADKANIPAKSKVTVTNDSTSTNNGDWQWDGTNFTKSIYDPLTQSKDFTVSYVDKSIKKGPAKPFFAVASSNDAHVFWVDSNCEIWTFGSNYSINQLIVQLQDKTKPLLKKDSRSIFNFIDLNSDSFFRIGQEGYLYLFDQTLSVQSQFKVITDQLNAPQKNFSLKSNSIIKKRDLYNTDYLERLGNVRATSPYVCPVPRWMSKQRFTLGQNWVNTIKLTVPTERIVVPGYDPSWKEDIGVVHPQIIEFEQKMAGYKYWLGLNPYTNTNEDIELPFIYGSNDPELKKWELISGFPTPFDRDPPNINGVTSGFCSDSGFVYDVKRGDLLFFWRRTLRYDGQTTPDKITNEIVAKSTCDGKNWSDYVWLRDAYFVNDGTELDEMLSPNILYNPTDDLYYLYAISNGKLYYRTTEDIRSRQWSSKTEAVLTGFPVATAIWHFDMRFVGNKLVAMLHVDSSDAYYFAVSDDMQNFTSSQSTVVTNPNPNLYKPSFLPILDESTFKLRCIFTSDQVTTPRWQLKVADTTIESIGDL